MTQRSSLTSPADLIEVGSPTRLLPGEDEGAYDALRQALLADLAPSTPYQKILAENLVDLEWEATRYRDFRDNLLIVSARNTALQLIDGDEDSWEFEPSEEALHHAASIFGPDGKVKTASISVLEQAGTSVGELLAGAYASEAKTLDHLALHIAEIEARRRRLLDDYERLKARRAKSVPDAEILGDHDD